MDLKEQLIQEINQIPEPLLSQLLDFALFIKARYVEDDISEEEQAIITAAKSDYEAKNYQAIKQYEQSSASDSTTAAQRNKTQVKALQGWFDKTKPAPADFNPDEAKWEALKEKYDL